MKIIKWVLFGLAGVLVLLNLLPYILIFALGAPGDASSIGIIGGADGPTAIFVASSFGSGQLLAWLAPALLFAAGLVLHFLGKNKKDKGNPS